MIRNYIIINMVIALAALVFNKTFAANDFNAARVFSDLNCEELQNITHSTRLDMLDYYKAGMKRSFFNGSESICTLDSLSDNYLRLTLTSASNMQIKLLPLSNNDSIVMTLYTVGTDNMAPDTEVSFYNKSLQVLRQNNFWPNLKVEDFLNLQNITKEMRKNILGSIPFPTYEITVSPSSDYATATLTISKYLPKEEFDFIKPYLIPSRKLLWNGKKFILKK